MVAVTESLSPVPVAVVSASAALRAGLRALLEGDAPAPGDLGRVQVVASGDAASVRGAVIEAAVWVMDEAALGRLEPELLSGAVVVVLAGGGLSGALRAALEGAPRGHGLALVQFDVTASELVAAVLAADAGFVVLPPALISELGRDGAPERSTGAPALTEREHDVLLGLTAGSSNKRIAAHLGVSPNTVKYHLASLYSKLGVSSRAGAVREGVRLGLLSV